MGRHQPSTQNKNKQKSKYFFREIGMSFLGSFSGTSPGGRAGGQADAGFFKIKANSAQLSWIWG
jgi:hypothetical protein